MKRLLKRLLVVLAVAAMVPPALAWAAGQNVAGSISLNAQFSETISSGVINPLSISQGIAQSDNYTNGTGSGQVDTWYAAQITLVASTPQTLDLTALTDPGSKSANFARVRELLVQNTATTAGYDAAVSAGASNGVAFLPASGSGTRCRYGSVLRIGDKLSTGAGNGNVVDGTHKTITFDPGSNGPIVLNVLIMGCSAQ